MNKEQEECMNMKKFEQFLSATLNSDIYKNECAILVDVSGSCQKELIETYLKYILTHIWSEDCKRSVGNHSRVDIITWDSNLRGGYLNIQPGTEDVYENIPSNLIIAGGGTNLTSGIKYLKNHYEKYTTLIIISDCEDFLGEWKEVIESMPDHKILVINYGSQEEIDLGHAICFHEDEEKIEENNCIKIVCTSGSPVSYNLINNSTGSLILDEWYDEIIPTKLGNIISDSGFICVRKNVLKYLININDSDKTCIPFTTVEALLKDTSSRWN